MGSYLSTSRDMAALPEIKQPQFNVLPVELALQVASHLSRKDVKNLRSVNKRCFGRLNVLESAHSREILLQTSRDQHLNYHVREICICSTLGFVQLVQRSEAGDFDVDVLRTQKATAPLGSFDAIIHLAEKFHDLDSLDISLGIGKKKDLVKLFAKQKFQNALCNMINGLGPRLTYLSLTNGTIYSSEPIPIDDLLKNLKLKGIPYVKLGRLWGLTYDLINQLEDCKGTLKGLNLVIYCPVRGNLSNVWSEKLDSLRETLRLDYLDFETFPVAMRDIPSFFTSGMYVN